MTKEHMWGWGFPAFVLSREREELDAHGGLLCRQGYANIWFAVKTFLGGEAVPYASRVKQEVASGA